MKETALAAIGKASGCVEICLHNKEYREGMRFDSRAAFAGPFLLRFARLFPDDMDEDVSLVEELS